VAPFADSSSTAAAPGSGTFDPADRNQLKKGVVLTRGDAWRRGL
jgi:hypothetical protein